MTAAPGPPQGQEQSAAKAPPRPPPPASPDTELLLRSGVLMTKNRAPSPTRPLESILRVNLHSPSKTRTFTIPQLPHLVHQNPLLQQQQQQHQLRTTPRRPPTTIIATARSKAATLTPARPKTRGIYLPADAPKEDLQSFGFGIYYIPPFQIDNASQFPPNESVIDDSIAPRNHDPVHENVDPMPGYDKEPIQGTRFMLQHLHCGSQVTLPDIYHFSEAADARKTPKQKAWAERKKHSDRVAEEVARIMITKENSNGQRRWRIKTPKADIAIPSRLLDPLYTLRFHETTMFGEPAKPPLPSWVHHSKPSITPPTPLETRIKVQDIVGTLGDGQQFPALFPSFKAKTAKGYHSSMAKLNRSPMSKHKLL